MDNANLQQTLTAAIRDVERLPSHSPERIETTAHQLEKIGYSPMLIIPVESFIRFKKDDVIREMKKTASLDESEMAALGFTDGSEHDGRKIQQLSLLRYFFSLVSRLRNDDPDAWNEVSELYQDD
jgi:tRNA/tmRNA/rRNA uracil-C5-methylase (TrmA/RlmC/RlmD family)